LMVCLSQPARFRALSYYYGSFPQLSDSEVLDIMALARMNADERRRSGAHIARKSRSEAGS
ncbi:MAG: phosphoribosyltransferase, partial [Alphaproteobacteria bacterium]|nr:phosphoribosyltransferase [Alphaproteobacteria bacterium]